MNQSPTATTPLQVTTSSVMEEGGVALISASWHTDIVHQARDAAVRRLTALGTAPARIHLFDVPGAFEIPLLAQKLADSGQFQAIICCALVVNGGVYRHEFVSAAVIDGLMRIQLDTGIPVFSAVLTPCNFHEHEDHQDFFRQHFVKKGTEVANACAATLEQHAALEAFLTRQNQD